MHDQRTVMPGTDIDLNQRNDITGLRALLMNEIRSLDAKATKEQLEIARVKCELSNTIIDSVKAEALYLQVTKSISSSGFIPKEQKAIEDR
jgi:hypothetical protein